MGQCCLHILRCCNYISEVTTRCLHQEVFCSNKTNELVLTALKHEKELFLWLFYGTPLRTKGYQVESIKHLILGLTKKEYRNMNINIYTAFFWEVHEKIEMNVRKWPFKYPEEAQICFDLFLQYLSSVVFQYCL